MLLGRPHLLFLLLSIIAALLATSSVVEAQAIAPVTIDIDNRAAVSWPFTVVVQVDPDIDWDVLELWGPDLAAPTIPVTPDETGRFEHTFGPGRLGFWAGGNMLEINVNGVHFEGGNRTIESARVEFRFAPGVLDMTPPSIDGPLVVDSMPFVAVVPVESAWEITSVNVRDRNTLGIVVERVGVDSARIEIYENAGSATETQVLLWAHSFGGGSALIPLDIEFAPPELTIESQSEPFTYPILMSGTWSSSSEYPLVGFELDWNGPPVEPDAFAFDRRADGTWGVRFDPRLVREWNWFQAPAAIVHITLRDNSGRSETVSAAMSFAPVVNYCGGYGVTVDLNEGDLPTDGDDIILGTPLRDRIDAGAGDDVVCSIGGWDIVDLGAGDDTVYAGRGNDRLIGGPGNDTIDAGWGADTVDAGPGSDQVFGRRGPDVLVLGTGNDYAEGNQGGDRIFGDDGDDRLFGLTGSDRIEGGDGNDLVIGGVGRDRLLGGAGRDRVGGDAGRDRIELGPGDDVGAGGDHDDEILGASGRDAMYGEAGNDILSGGADDDFANGGDGTDRCAAERTEECE